MIDSILTELDAGVGRLRTPSTAQVRAVRRVASRKLRQSAGADVLAIAERLIERDELFDRFIAYEMIAAHPGARALLGRAGLERLGRGMDSWGDVDTFASYVAGPAWRERQVSDADVARWARSDDRWWRRAALVSTVPLNNKARGGTGDARRTLAICELAVGDADPMVVKALSWALRELAKRTPEPVERFLARHEARLASLVRREVRSKLSIGLKTPRRRATPR